MADPDGLTGLTKDEAVETVAVLRRVLDALPPDDSTTAKDEPTTASREDLALRARLTAACDLFDAGQQ